MADRNDWDRASERGSRWDWDRNREERGSVNYGNEREPWRGSGSWDRERDWGMEGRHDRGWNRSEYDRPELGRGREEWERQDWRHEPSRAPEYGPGGDYGNQGTWGRYGNRQSWGSGHDWQWNWNPRGRAEYGGGPSYTGGYGGGMGSYSGGMGESGQRGQHAGRGPKGWQRSDDRIRDDISERLTDHPDVDAREIQVQVREGEVTLTGTVEERRAKRLAEDIAENVSGVKDVHNQLRVQPAGQHAGATGTQEHK